MKAKELFAHARALVLLCLAGAIQLQAAEITTLYNTGVSETGALLAENEVDPHYTITYSDDVAFPGPEAYTLLPGFPVGPWLAEGPDSRWITPQADQSVGNAPGLYIFTTTFDLTGFDPSTVRISGRAAADNDLVAVRLNSSPLNITASGFGAWTSFTFPEDAFYLEGINTLEFDLQNAGEAANPVGFRIEFDARGTTPEDLPNILVPPQNVNAFVGADVTLSVQAEGAPPLEYQWLRDDQVITGATEATYSIPAAAADASGSYSVRVSNDLGEVTSDPVQVRVVEPFPGLYDTGVDENRLLIEDYLDDPHYVLVVNPNDAQLSTPIVQNSSAFPIVEGPWIANSTSSKWIGPLGDTTSAATGDYVYRLELDLTGYDPATAWIAGRWATDNEGVILLNGAETEFTSPGFNVFSNFEITSGFVSGINNLEFRVNNAGAGYTGLRVENLVGTAEESTGTILEPRIATQPQSRTRVLTDSVTFAVVADGAQPLSYQWSRDGEEIEGATSPTYTIDQVLGDDEGAYTVEVTNVHGSATSNPAQLSVIAPELGVFSTGVDSTGTPLPLGEPDPHYILLSSPDTAFPGPTAYALSGAPIGPWVANTETSQWIGHRPNGADGTPGAYRYRLIFEIPPEDVDTASITGQIATDDGNGGIFLNGNPVTVEATLFTEYRALDIPAGSGFVAGLNTLDVIVSNGGAAANPTGLRLENLTLSGVTIPDEPPSATVTEVDGQLQISWPVGATGFTLQETSSLPGGWTNSSATINVIGDQNVATIEVTGDARFFRLIQ